MSVQGSWLPKGKISTKIYNFFQPLCRTILKEWGGEVGGGELGFQVCLLHASELCVFPTFGWLSRGKKYRNICSHPVGIAAIRWELQPSGGNWQRFSLLFKSKSSSTIIVVSLEVHGINSTVPIDPGLWEYSDKTSLKPVKCSPKGEERLWWNKEWIIQRNWSVSSPLGV